MKNYEIMLLINSDLSDAEIQKVLDKFKANLKKAKGEITFEDVWGRRDLAYPINKLTQGFYVVFQFNYDSTLIQKFNQDLLLDKDIFRFLISIPPKGFENVAYAEDVEEERKRRVTKKDERKKISQAKDEKNKEKIKIKSERYEKKMIRQIEHEIYKEKEIGISVPVKKTLSVEEPIEEKKPIKEKLVPVEKPVVIKKPSETKLNKSTSVDDKFDEKLNQIIGSDLDI